MTRDIKRLLREISRLDINRMSWRTAREAITRNRARAHAHPDFAGLAAAQHMLAPLAQANFGPAQAQQLAPIHRSEYLSLLIQECLVGDDVDWPRLAEVTEREVDAGRLDANHGLCQVAQAGASLSA